MCMRIDGNEVFTILKSVEMVLRLVVIKYFNKLLHTFLAQEGIPDDFYLWASIIPPEDF